MKRALITGINGQDGSYLAEFLLTKGYKVGGLMRRTSKPNTENIEGIREDIKIYDGDLLDQGSIDRAIIDFKPDEVYNLAAQSFVATSWNQPMLTGDVTGLGAVRVFESVRNINSKIKVYQASSSEMFGNTDDDSIDESTPMRATSPYAISKLYAHNMARNYRDSFGMFVAGGILFNHESPRRGMEFVTRKITYAIALLSLGIKNSKTLNEQKEPLVKDGKVKMGNLDASRDWGFAGDYVEAMWMMLQQDEPDDFVIATGRSTSIREFLDIAFKYIGLGDWHKYIESDQKFLRPADLRRLKGNAAKAKKVLNWKPTVSLEKLVEMMVDSDIELAKRKENI